MNEYQDQDVWFEVQRISTIYNTYITIGDYDTREIAETEMPKNAEIGEYRVIKVYGQA